MGNIEEIFKAYDIRGKVGEQLTPELVRNIGRAFADWLPEPGVVAVGRDMRPDSAELTQAFIEGVTMQGRNVQDIGQVTTDMIYFAVGKFELAGGAVITASHNPGQYNGIKFCREGANGISLDSGLADIRDAVINNSFKPSDIRGSVTQHNVDEAWISHVLELVRDTELKPLKIAVDAGNGMAGKIFAQLEPHVPFEVIEMYFELDGTFPNHPASPIEPQNLVDIITRIKQEGADGGIAFDGDGDRAVLIDEQGEPLTGTVMTAMLAEYFLRRHPGATILINAICGRAALETIAANSGKAIRTKVGHSYIKNDMRTHSAVFAGEHSYHFYFKENYWADSGLIAAMVGLAVLSDSGQKLSELAARYRTYQQIPETNFKVSDKEAVMQQVAQSFPDGEQDWLDGLTVNFENSWFNIRPSNTEPLLRLNAEAKTADELDTIVNKVTKLIKD